MDLAWLRADNWVTESGSPGQPLARLTGRKRQRPTNGPSLRCLLALQGRPFAFDRRGQVFHAGAAFYFQHGSLLGRRYGFQRLAAALNDSVRVYSN
jgi:hypothetical protein